MTQPRTPRSPRSAAPRLRAVSATSATATPAPDAPDKPPRENGWTLAKQAAFLRALSASHSVSEAARIVGKSRQSAYQLRSKLKGQPFDLAWEVAFHHSYDVLAHTALERALNGVEVPVFFQGEQVGAYRRFDERLTVALLSRFTMGGNPAFGRLGAMAERHARDFESLLAKLEAGEAVDTGALSPDDPDEFAGLRGSLGDTKKGAFPCPSSMSDDELMDILQGNVWQEGT
jgi:hypothetical protein